MDEFQENIKEWVAADTQLRELTQQVKLLRERRAELSDDIHDHVSSHNLSNAIVNISDGKLRFTSTRQTSPLTLKYVQECLESCLSNEADIAHIMSVLKESRNVKYVPEIKRTYNE